MKQEGISVLAGCRWFMTIAHTDADVDRTLEAADKVMATL
jgi:glutamate-1-semialdehyde aminotransferase